MDGTARGHTKSQYIDILLIDTICIELMSMLIVCNALNRIAIYLRG